MKHLKRQTVTILGCLAAGPAFAQGFSDASAIPPPPTLIEPVFVLLAFLAIFVGAAWSLSALMGITHRPARMRLWRRPRLRL
jgi:hypothetical protein